MIRIVLILISVRPIWEWVRMMYEGLIGDGIQDLLPKLRECSRNTSGRPTTAFGLKSMIGFFSLLGLA